MTEQRDVIAKFMPYFPPRSVHTDRVERLEIDLRSGVMTPVTSEQMRKHWAGKLVFVPK